MIQLEKRVAGPRRPPVRRTYIIFEMRDGLISTYVYDYSSPIEHFDINII